MKIFICGMCKRKGVNFCSSRKGLRDHIKEEHRIFHGLANETGIKEEAQRHFRKVKRSWWIAEEV